MIYLTPAKFLTLRTGIDVSALSLVEIAAVLERASEVANSFCSVPTAPTKHDFRGGTVGQGADGGVIDPLLVSPVGNPARAAYLTQSSEAHMWRYPMNDFDIGQRRYYPFHWPVRTINLFRIYVTNSQYVEIQPTDIFINNQERYAEIVSLAVTSAGLFNALIIPNVGLAVPQARAWYTYGFDFLVFGEQVYAAEGNTLYRAANQWWNNDTNSPVVVYVNGVVQNSGYTVDYNEGTVTFSSPVGPEDDPSNSPVVTVDYHYSMPSEVAIAVSLIARYEFGEADLAAKSLTGLESIRVGDMLEVNRPRALRNSTQTVDADNLAQLVPQAARLLTGYKYTTVRA